MGSRFTGAYPDKRDGPTVDRSPQPIAILTIRSSRRRVAVAPFPAAPDAGKVTPTNNTGGTTPMTPLIPTIALTLAAACVLVNLWLAMRIGRLRMKNRVSHGDGGHPLLARRMRAQLNFAENVPLLVVLVALLEVSGVNRSWLAALAATLVLARIAHGFGMDADTGSKARMLGVVATMLVALALVVLGVLAAYGVIPLGSARG